MSGRGANTRYRPGEKRLGRTAIATRVGAALMQRTTHNEIRIIPDGTGRRPDG